MIRAAIAVIVGYIVWSAIWVGANAALFSGAAEAVSKQEPVTQMPVLLGLLVTSVICSLVAGAVCGGIKPSVSAAAVLGALLLLTGIGVQSSLWNLMPLWYHAAFLLLLIPVTMQAARLASPRRLPARVPTA
ncbi:MAG: hypothetical protein NTV94_11795 [Planctomycetota bacterium]|nr:hypothetical protein [Planctomycetota bacterium]